jgi:acyl-CoA synthetase (AMP-forming)/AMP-acid ligase II
MPAETAAAFDGNDHSGYFHTGDLARRDEDGFHFIVGRKKDMFISGGFNVYPAEVEKMLAAHPALAQAAVVGVPDERLGEVGRAYVMLRPGAQATEAELIAWSRDTMANYKVPRSFAFVSDFPRNAAGKVLKTQLRDSTGAQA